MCTNLSECYAQFRLDYNAKSCLLTLDRNTHIFHLHDNNSTVMNVQPDQEGNKLQRQKILILIYPIYNHNWRNISTIYIYIYNKT